MIWILYTLILLAAGALVYLGYKEFSNEPSEANMSNGFPMVDYLMNEWQLTRDQTVAQMKRLGQEKYLNTDMHGKPLDAQEKEK